MAVAISEAATSGVPLTSAGLSGSAGSAASRSHSTRSADCACANVAVAAIAIAATATRPIAANEDRWDRFIMAYIGGQRLASKSPPIQGLEARRAQHRGDLRGSEIFQERVGLNRPH